MFIGSSPFALLSMIHTMASGGGRKLHKKMETVVNSDLSHSQASPASEDAYPAHPQGIHPAQTSCTAVAQHAAGPLQTIIIQPLQTTLVPHPAVVKPAPVSIQPAPPIGESKTALTTL